MPLKPITAMRKDRASANSVKLQHRHFAFIAGLIAKSGERTEDKRRIVDLLAKGLATTNPNFDRARFFTAAGVDDPYITQAAYPNMDEFKEASPEDTAQAYDIIRRR